MRGKPSRERRCGPVGRALLILVLAQLLIAAAAASQSIQAVVDRNQVSLQEQVRLDITVEGSQTARPRLPALDTFQVLPAGNTTRMQIVNGRATSSITYSYVLVPKSVGEFNFGAATVEIDGEIYSSRPFKLVVVEQGQAVPAHSRDYFLTARVSNERPFVGEQVLYTWRFYRRVAVADARLMSLEFGDILSEDIGDVREYRTTVDGVQYNVSEIRKALFPQRAGAAVIPPSEMSCQVAVRAQRRRRSVFDDVFGRTPMETKVLVTDPIELEVRELPREPEGFSGLVGDFALEASIGKRELKVGESTTLSLTISGTGNAQMLSEPPLPELSAFKVYDDKPSGSIDRSGSQLRGTKTYRKALVPLLPGQLEIPPVQIVYFDPKSATFKTAASPAIELDVAAAEGEEELMLTESMAPTTGKVAVKILADDILPIHRGLDALGTQSISGWRSTLWSSFAALPPLLFLALLTVRRRQRRYELDSGLRRRESAYKRATSRARGLPGVPECQHDPAALARHASLCLREYVGDKLGLEGAALTPDEVFELLCERSVDEPTARRAREYLERLEASQFGVRTQELQCEQLSRSLIALLESLDQQVREQ